MNTKDEVNVIAEIFSSFAASPHGWWYGLFKDFAAPFATVIAAITVTWVTFVMQRRQWKTAKDKLKLDLYDRRYDVFDAVMKLAAPITYDPVDFDSLSKRANISEFLFDEKVNRFVRETVEVATGIHLTSAAMARGAVGDTQWDALTGKNMAQLNQRHVLSSQVREIFRPFLSFEHIK